MGTEICPGKGVLKKRDGNMGNMKKHSLWWVCGLGISDGKIPGRKNK